MKALLGCVAVALFVGGCASDLRPVEGTALAANSSIKRAVSGEYVYREISGSVIRGWEKFQLFVHPDGERTLLMWHNLAARDAQFSVILRVDKAFRPIEGYLSYWVEKGFKGTSMIRVSESDLSISSAGPAGEHNSVINTPAQFSLGTHPVSGDGWHTPSRELTDGQSTQLRLFSVEASNDLEKLPRGTWVDMSIERVARETIDVPAGRFETVHYRLAGVSDIWVHGPDRLLIRMQMPARNLEYVLVELDKQETAE